MSVSVRICWIGSRLDRFHSPYGFLARLTTIFLTSLGFKYVCILDSALLDLGRDRFDILLPIVRKCWLVFLFGRLVLIESLLSI